jgi:hypothetical protein
MLNPSTADWTVNDPTIGRCTSFARGWGFDAIHVVNLFALRATYPAQVTAEHDLGALIGPDYWLELEEALAATAAEQVVCGWGTKGRQLRQDERVLTWFGHAGVAPVCLGRNADRTPVHLLYQPSRAELAPL